jgi:hypothetical protein
MDATQSAPARRASGLLPERITTVEAGRLLGCDPQSVINYVRAGFLMGGQVRPRGRWWVDLASVLAMREGRRAFSTRPN